MMDELLKKLAAKGQSKAKPEEVKAKMEVVQELLQMAQDAMAENVHSGMVEMQPKPEASVKVSAEDPESLAEGLDMAKELVGESEDEPMDESPEHESAESADHEKMEDDEDSEEEDSKKAKKAFPSLL